MKKLTEEHAYEIENACGHVGCPVWKQQVQADATVRFLEERLDSAYEARRQARAAYTAHLDAVASEAA